MLLKVPRAPAAQNTRALVKVPRAPAVQHPECHCPELWDLRLQGHFLKVLMYRHPWNFKELTSLSAWLMDWLPWAQEELWDSPLLVPVWRVCLCPTPARGLRMRGCLQHFVFYIVTKITSAWGLGDLLRSFLAPGFFNLEITLRDYSKQIFARQVKASIFLWF